ncbi:HAD hydrolase family protein [Actinomycetaceae bacterium L2_0104]
MPSSLAMIDVDGTLMHRGDWNPGAHELITHLAEKGLHVALCSGRPTGGLISLAREMPAVSLVVSSSGTTALARESEDVDASWRMLDHRTLDPVLVAQAMKLADRAGIETWAYTARDWLVREISARVRDEWTFIGDTPHIDPIVGREDIGKFLFLVEGQAHSSVLGQIDEWEGVGVVMSGKTYADLVPEVATHTKGGDLLTEHLGIGWEDVLAIGDGQNDIGMLSRAGQAIGVAPLAEDMLPTPARGQRRGYAANTAEALEIAREWV